MRPAVYLLPLTWGLIGSSAQAEVVARSRNSVVFVESIQEGAEWEAFRLVDPKHPAIYRVEGPGRVLLRVRTLPRAEPVEAVAAALDGEQVVLTLRVPATPDPQARLSDGGVRPSLAKLYLLEVGEGRARITVRHSEGPPLLVAARFAPPLQADLSETGVPLVAPRAGPKASVPRVGALERGAGLASGPEKPDPQARPIEAPLPEGDGAEPTATSTASRTRTATAAPAASPRPRLAESHPAFDEALDLDARPTGRGAFLLAEAHAGPHFDRLIGRPGVTAGFDLRGALFSASRPRAMSVGVSLDLGYAFDDTEVRIGGAPVDAARVRHVFGALTADLRGRLFAKPGVAELYLSGGGGVALGRTSVRTSRGTESSGSAGYFGAARLGTTLGTSGHRPFLELRAWVGRLQSQVLRAGPTEEVGGGVTWWAGAAVLGWRFELGFDARPGRPRRP